MPTRTDTATFGCQLASTYLALDFWGSQNRNAFSILQCQGVSVGSGNFLIFHVFTKKFPRGPRDAFCGFVCFRTSKISGDFRESDNKCVGVYQSPGCFAALRRYPCLRVQSSNLTLLKRYARESDHPNPDALCFFVGCQHVWVFVGLSAAWSAPDSVPN